MPEHERDRCTPRPFRVMIPSAFRAKSKLAAKRIIATLGCRTYSQAMYRAAAALGGETLGRVLRRALHGYLRVTGVVSSAPSALLVVFINTLNLFYRPYYNTAYPATYTHAHVNVTDQVRRAAKLPAVRSRASEHRHDLTPHSGLVVHVQFPGCVFAI